MALVGKLWHNALAPTAGACMPALTRQITLGAQDMLSVQELAQPWWGWIRGQKSVRIITDIEIVSLAAACPTIKRLELVGVPTRSWTQRWQASQLGAAPLRIWISLTAFKSRTQGWRVWLPDAAPLPLCTSVAAIISRTRGWRVWLLDAGPSPLWTSSAAIRSQIKAWRVWLLDALILKL